ncbi:hypothetical protein EDD36DRAFT_253325 [Exophiala viscosa]|uniref:Uncharacterized protein n=1 Tax=Exophiala viscosa TaxID=2486360 RepID=A0AAN6DVT8_9EURO|nr:hypothetical protein EDD36DRAFT_253325 [Exophiala viscosa]
MSTGKLSIEQWEALITLHRTLLHEQHDFSPATRHPKFSPALRSIATTYRMPARMWRDGIKGFLELLRRRLPESLEHMLTFVYVANQMMNLQMEEVPECSETWSECLEDLERYCMAIEEARKRDLYLWSLTTGSRCEGSGSLDGIASESLQDRQDRLLADADAVKKLQAFSDREASSSQYPTEAYASLTEQVDLIDYMNANARSDLQASLLSRECLSIGLDRMKDPENALSETEAQRTLVAEAYGRLERLPKHISCKCRN